MKYFEKLILIQGWLNMNCESENVKHIFSEELKILKKSCNKYIIKLIADGGFDFYRKHLGEQGIKYYDLIKEECIGIYYRSIQ